MKLEKLHNVKIAIITSNDQTFLLPTWAKTIKFLKKKYFFKRGFYI